MAIMRRILIRFVLGLLALAAASKMALADTTTLVCNNNNGTITIDLDEAQHTVSMGVTPTRPVPAVFDSKKITFTEVPCSTYTDGQCTWNYTLDRVTGILSMILGNGVRFPNLYTCHPGKVQF